MLSSLTPVGSRTQFCCLVVGCAGTLNCQSGVVAVIHSPGSNPLNPWRPCLVLSPFGAQPVLPRSVRSASLFIGSQDIFT